MEVRVEVVVFELGCYVLLGFRRVEIRVGKDILGRRVVEGFGLGVSFGRKAGNEFYTLVFLRSI